VSSLGRRHETLAAATPLTSVSAAGARLRHNPGGRARMVAAGLWSFLRCVGFEEEEGRSQQG
jgi:hypothetical protein